MFDADYPYTGVIIPRRTTIGETGTEKTNIFKGMRRKKTWDASMQIKLVEKVGDSG